MAAVLYWRLPALTPANPSPLPWLPGIPSKLHDNPVWGDYLAKRSQLVADAAGRAAAHGSDQSQPRSWASRAAAVRLVAPSLRMASDR